MKVQILFFGATAEEVGKREIELDLATETSAREAFQRVVSDYPKLQNHKLLFAVNQEYSDGSETLKANDELAVFTAVSGG